MDGIVRVCYPAIEDFDHAREATMQIVRKRLVTDEAHRPIAVQIDYDDWLRIERQLKIQAPSRPAVDLARYAGTVHLTESPLAYQIRSRNEWS